MTGGDEANASAANEDLADRVTALEQTVAELEDAVATATDQDLPLVKGTLRAMCGTEVETIDELPDAGRAFNERVADHEERLLEVEQRLNALADIDDGPSSKEAKFAAVLQFAANKRNGSAKVTVTPHEVKGCTGVSRRYSYELMNAMAEQVDGVRVRDEQQVQTGSGTERKGKALLVDCETVHDGDGVVNKFTTVEEVSGVE